MSDGPAPALADLGAVPGEGGVVWSAAPSGVHANLVVLAAGQSIGEHVNDAVDVLVVALAGSATVTIDGHASELAPLRAVLLPRGTTRAVLAGSDGVRYLTVHEQRPPLGIHRPPPEGAPPT
jgi:quercetin dioxygenase-like cupin family protein